MIVKTIRIFFFISYIICFLGCEKEISLINRNETPKFVIWCRLHPDSVIVAYVSKTSPPLAPKSERIITDAAVILYENGIAVDTLKNDRLTIYNSSKGFKPQANNIYFLKVSKSGMLTAETFADTMPPKPVLIRYIAKDSIKFVSSSAHLAQLELFTDFPKNYGYYYLGGGTYQYFNYLGVYGDAEFFWNITENCDSRIEGNLCKYPATTYYQFINQINSRPSQLKGKKMKLILYAQTRNSIILGGIKYNGGYAGEDTDLYFEPTFTPETIKNGYGSLTCRNTLNFEVQF
jgi:Domain of unknown function (DUF4249)